MEIKTIILYGLSTWRLSNMLLNETGPMGIFLQFRAWLGIEHVDEAPVGYPDTFLGKLFSCIYCLSVWVGSAFVISHYIFYNITFALAVVLAISTLAILIDRITQSL